MNDKDGTQANLLRQFPLALQVDKQMQIIATVIAAALAQRWPEAELGILYPAIDRLPEQLLDILAYDFKVDWWDPEYSIEEKRRTLKDSWRVHKTLGTKAAVETAISAIYPRTKVIEWWEYGGEPYHFRLDINITNDTIDSDKQRRVLQRLNYYKNLRSHNDGVTYFVEAAPAIARAVPYVPGVVEDFHASFEIPVPVIRAAAAVRTDAAAAVWETFSTAITILGKALSVTGQTGAGSAVLSTQETAKTHINLQEVDYGGTE